MINLIQLSAFYFIHRAGLLDSLSSNKPTAAASPLSPLPQAVAAADVLPDSTATHQMRPQQEANRNRAPPAAAAASAAAGFDAPPPPTLHTPKMTYINGTAFKYRDTSKKTPSPPAAPVCLLPA